MAREIPEVVRAAAGLAATVLDEARKLPETLPGLPVRLIGLAMQQAMKVQQQYAGLVARGDEVFTGVRGADEPGLATFEDDEPVPSSGFRDSAFDRADDVAGTVGELAEEAPGTEEILDEIAIDELVDQAPALDETAPTADAGTPETDVTADVATPVDVLTGDGDVATVDAAVTDEGLATAPESGTAEPATATDESGSPVAAATAAPADADGGGAPPRPKAAGTAPVDGYDDFSIAQLRGRLRGYQLSTVQDLRAYEEATRAREPYLRMLRNRLEKLEQQAVESSPLAPRG
jgi:hypothetical protein